MLCDGDDGENTKSVESAAAVMKIQTSYIVVTIPDGNQSAMCPTSSRTSAHHFTTSCSQPTRGQSSPTHTNWLRFVSSCIIIENMSDTYNNTKETASDNAEHAKRFGQDKLGQAQDGAQDMAGGVNHKAHQASSMAGEKWDQTKQGASDISQAAQDKAGHAKDTTGGVLGSIGAKVEETFTSAKNAVTGNH